MRIHLIVSSMAISLFQLGIAYAQADENDAVVYAVEFDGAHVRQLPDVAGYTFLGSPAASPDGQWLALDGRKPGKGTPDAHLVVLNLATKEVRDLGPGAMPTWSADGKRLAYSSFRPRGIYIRSLEGDDNELIDERGWGIQWSPDGQTVVYTEQFQGGAQLFLYDLKTKRRRGLFDQNATAYQQIYWNCEWAPDSKSIAVMGVRHDGSRDVSIIRLGEADELVALEYLCDATGFYTDMAWHPTEPFLIIPQENNRLYRINFFGAQQPTLLETQPTDRPITGCCWTRDGKSLIVSSKIRETP